MSRARLYATTITCLIVPALLAGCDPETTTAQANPKKAAATSSDIPAGYLQLYQSAPLCPSLPWQVLAAVGKIETDHGRSTLPGVHSGENSAHARGPMQFLPGTWRGVRQRHPDVGGDVYNPAHAIPAAAHKLCDDGANKGSVRKALYRYNHSNQYVDDVLAVAGRY